jgi:hypothetical protein
LSPRKIYFGNMGLFGMMILFGIVEFYKSNNAIDKHLNLMIIGIGLAGLTVVNRMLPP